MAIASDDLTSSVVTLSDDSDTPKPEPAVINLQVFEQNSAYLDAKTVVTYLEKIATGSNDLLLKLRPINVDRINDTVAEAAHTLAGSASMFGFERLAAAARDFESAVQTHAADASFRAERLSAALVVSLPEMRRLASASAGA